MSVIRTHEVTLTGRTDKHKITLRPLSDEHLPLLYKWNSDPEVLYWSDGSVVEAYDEESVKGIYGQTSQTAICFLVEADGVPIGECWLQQMNLKAMLDRHSPSEDIRRIDMMIGEKAYWNSGIGTALIGMLVDFAFMDEGVDYVYGMISDYNIRSARVFEKNGFELYLREPSTQAPAKAKEDFYFRLGRKEYTEQRRAIAAPDKIFMLPITDLQPSQLYISEGKLKLLHDWFDPADKSNFDPIPIKLYEGRHMMTDGHTRAAAAALAGWTEVPVAWDDDPLDMRLYSECVRWCDEAGIKNAADLAGRIISPREYAVLWHKRCDEMHEMLL